MGKKIGLIGAGSVGSVLLSYLCPAYKEDFMLLAVGDRAERLREKGVCINNVTYYPTVYSEPEQNMQVDLLLIAVKSYALDSVIKDIRPLIQRDTMILPVLNGITATDRLKEAFPDNRVFYGLILRTDAYRTGHKVYFTTPGELQFGYADNRKTLPEVQETLNLLTKAGVKARIYDDMRRAQWRKWMLNTGAGQAAVEIGVECGFFGEVPQILEIMRRCMDEILELAKAEQVNLTEQDRDEILELLVNYPARKKMSMLQDVEAGRPIEIEEYAGEVIRLGKKHGIPTPMNELIYLTITARECVARMRKHI